MWAGLRLVLGGATLIAIGWQLGIHVRLGLSVVNFFSYFTNLSNLFAASVFILTARSLVSNRETVALEDQTRGLSTLNMAITGIVFTLLLRNVDLGALLPWVNVLLHYVMPCAVILDWLLQPPKTTLRVRHLVRCLIFPALYLAYVLVRGAAINWYPYPFLDPANVGGYGGVSLYAVGIAVAFLGVGGVLLGLGNRLKSEA